MSTVTQGDLKMKETILNILERNARMSNKDLAAIVGIDEAAVAGVIAEMEDSHIIQGYNTVIDWSAVGEEKADAFIEVKVSLSRGTGFDAIADKIYQFPEVTSMYLMSGNFDFGVFVHGKSMKEVAMFVSERLSTIDGVTNTSTQFVLKKYKDHGIQISDVSEDEREKIS